MNWVGGKYNVFPPILFSRKAVKTNLSQAVSYRTMSDIFWLQVGKCPPEFVAISKYKYLGCIKKKVPEGSLQGLFYAVIKKVLFIKKH